VSVIQGPTVIFGAEFTGLEGATAGLDGLRRSTERARDQFGRFIKTGGDAAAALSRLGGDGTKALDETAKAALQINPALEQMLVGVNKASQGFKDFAGKQASGIMEALADDIEQTTDGFDRLRGAVDATTDTLRLFGRGSRDLADLIDDTISDPALRAKEALRALNATQGRMARANRALADGFAVARVRIVQAVGGVAAFNAIMGTARMAVLGLGAALAGGLAAGFALALEGNKKMKRDFEAMINQGKRFVSALAQIVLGLLGFGDGVKSVTERMKSFTDTMVKNQGQIREQVAGTLDVLAEFVRYLGNAFLVVKMLTFDMPKAGLQSMALAARLAMVVLSKMSEKIADLTFKAGQLLQALGEATGSGALAKRGQQLQVVGLQAMGQAMAATQLNLREAKDMADSFYASLDGMVDQMLAVDSAAERMKGAARNIREAGDVAVDTSGIGGGGGGGGGKKKGRVFAAQTITNVDPRVMAFAEMNKAMAEGRLLGANFTAELAKMDLTAVASAQIMDDLGRSIGGSLANGYLQLADAVGTAMGAFAAGTGTLSQFGDAILDTFGSLAGSIGDFYLKAGLGMMFLPGGQAAGAGLMAAGLGLKVLGGFLSGKGSGNRGAGRSSGGTAAAVDPSRFMRPERDTEPSVTNLKVVILGEEIERPVTRFIDDVARRGGFRNLATRT
jgi:hypothetical protein